MRDSCGFVRHVEHISLIDGDISDVVVTNVHQRCDDIPSAIIVIIIRYFTVIVSILLRVHNILVSHSEESKQLSDHRVVVDGILARTERVAVVVYELQELLERCQGTVINNDWLSIAVNAAIDEELSLKLILH